MELLLLVSNPKSQSVLQPLMAACTRAGIDWGLFFTNDGVGMLGDETVQRAAADANRAVVCQESWNKYMQGIHCPVEAGSQTTNSEMAAAARRIVGL